MPLRSPQAYPNCSQGPWQQHGTPEILQYCRKAMSVQGCGRGSLQAILPCPFCQGIASPHHCQRSSPQHHLRLSCYLRKMMELSWGLSCYLRKMVELSWGRSPSWGLSCYLRKMMELSWGRSPYSGKKLRGSCAPSLVSTFQKAVIVLHLNSGWRLASMQELLLHWLKNSTPQTLLGNEAFWHLYLLQKEKLG